MVDSAGIGWDSLNVSVLLHSQVRNYSQFLQSVRVCQLCDGYCLLQIQDRKENIQLFAYIYYRYSMCMSLLSYFSSKCCITILQEHSVSWMRMSALATLAWMAPPVRTTRTTFCVSVRRDTKACCVRMMWMNVYPTLVCEEEHVGMRSTGSGKRSLPQIPWFKVTITPAL